MAVTLQRAFNCIGRKIERTDGTLRGTVERVDKHHIYVCNEEDTATVMCDPMDMDWTLTLPMPLVEALEEWVPWETAQAGFAPALWHNDDLTPMSNLAVVYSSGTANDNGLDRALYAIAPMLRRVVLLSITANQQWAWEIEEVLDFQGT